MANPLAISGAESGMYALDNQRATNMGKPAWENAPTFSPSAYGSIPSPVYPQSTAPADTAQAIGAGTQVYSQLPGYGGDIAKAGGNISSLLSGNVPSDVAYNIGEAAAERGVSTGGNSNAAYLKALGLTSLGLESTGLSELEGLLPTLPGANIANNPNLYLSPGQQYEGGVQNSVWGAAPQPALAAEAGYNATQAGFGAGAGAIRPSPVSIAAPVAPSPANTPGSITVSGSGVDQGNAPGSPGALTNWNDWYSSIMGTDTTSNPSPEDG